MPTGNIIGIKVRFTLNTTNGLRRVVFALEKTTEDEVVTWKINFELFEREKKTDPFGDAIVSLEIEVDKALNSKAEKIAKDGKMTSGQSAHALGPAADDAKAAKEGEIDQEDADQTIQNTLKKK